MSRVDPYAARVALPHAILVSLCEQSGSGYELAHRFDRSIGYFWSATHQQIYRTLRTMEDDGWVSATLVVQHGRPDKKVYTVSDAGRAELARWIAAPLSPDAAAHSAITAPVMWPSSCAAPPTATRQRCARRSPRCAPNAPSCWTPTADSRRDSSPIRRRCAAAHYINIWCCAAASAPRKARSTGSTR